MALTEAKDNEETQSTRSCAEKSWEAAMCPMCIGGAVVMVSGVMSSGGLSALTWKKLGGSTETRTDEEQTSSGVKVEGGKDESTNAGK
ncbi:MAG: hypothetical protein ABSG69_11630 [Candidatus Acidiferrum sp.]|jgi:hypothetical protein